MGWPRGLAGREVKQVVSFECTALFSSSWWARLQTSPIKEFQR